MTGGAATASPVMIEFGESATKRGHRRREIIQAWCGEDEYHLAIDRVDMFP